MRALKFPTEGQLEVGFGVEDRPLGTQRRHGRVDQLLKVAHAAIIAGHLPVTPVHMKHRSEQPALDRRVG